MGPAYMIPSIPRNRGRITNKGSRKIICRVRDRKVPFFGFPMEEKKVEDMGCRLLIKVKNR